MLEAVGIKSGLSLNVWRICGLPSLWVIHGMSVCLFTAYCCLFTKIVKQSCFFIYCMFAIWLGSCYAVSSYICSEKTIKSPCSSYDFFFKKESTFAYFRVSLCFRLIFPFLFRISAQRDSKLGVLKGSLGRSLRVCELWWKNKLKLYLYTNL